MYQNFQQLIQNLPAVTPARDRIVPVQSTCDLGDGRRLELTTTGHPGLYSMVTIMDRNGSGAPVVDPSGIFLLDEEQHRQLVAGRISQNADLARALADEFPTAAGNALRRNGKAEVPKPKHTKEELKGALQNDSEDWIGRNAALVESVKKGIETKNFCATFDPKNFNSAEAMAGFGAKADTYECVNYGGVLLIKSVTWAVNQKTGVTKVIIDTFGAGVELEKTISVEEIHKSTSVGIGFSYGMVATLDPKLIPTDLKSKPGEAKEGEPVFARGDRKTDGTGAGISFNASLAQQYYRFRMDARLHYVLDRKPAKQTVLVV